MVIKVLNIMFQQMHVGYDNDTLEDEEEAIMSSAIPSEVDPLDFVYTNIPDTTHILKLDANCKHCKAKKFVSETDGFCCRNGQIELKQPEPIPELMRLWSSMDADSRHFRENIRFFNGHFAFTTLGVSLDENYTNMKSGVYTFRAHGTIYHNVHSFGPSSRPEHLQLYFYDDDPTITHRKAATKQLDQDVVKKLVDILKENPYSQQFRSLGAHKDNLDDYRIDLNTDKRLDQRRYNRPLSSEVAAIWVEGNDLAKRFDRRITLCGNNNERHSIRVTSGAYDPLSYPLFYPRGELGWHPKLPKRNVPLEVVLNPQLVHDDDEDAGMPSASHFATNNILFLDYILILMVLNHVQRATAGCASLSETTTVTCCRHGLRSSIPYSVEHACCSNGRSTCMSRLRVVG